MLLLCVCVCVYVCVCVCVCVFIFLKREGFFRLQDVRDILRGKRRGYDERARSSVVNNLRSVSKGSRFESGC